LKTLLGAVTMVCLALAVFGSLIARSIRVREHRHSVQAVLALGGQIPWRSRRVGPDMPIAQLSLRAAPIGDSHLTVLHGLPELQALDLGETSVTDAGLRGLNGIDNLKSLSLGGTSLTDDGVEQLARFRRLETLDLSALPPVGPAASPS
jgi:hypothetical protein